MSNKLSKKVMTLNEGVESSRSSSCSIKIMCCTQTKMMLL